MIVDKRWQKAIAVVNCGYVVKPHHFDKPVLKCAVGSLNSSLGLWRVCANEFDFQIVKCAVNLGYDFLIGA